MQVKSSTPLVSKIPITKSSPYTYVAVASLDLPDVQAGDVWTFDVGEESTTSYDTNVMSAKYLKLSPDLTGFNTSQSEGVMLSVPKGHNITLDIHHDDWDLSRTWIAATDGPQRLLLVMYSASSSAPVWTVAAGWNLSITYVDLTATLVSRVEVPA